MGKVAKLPTAANDAPAPADEIVPPFEIAIAANFASEQQCHVRIPVKRAISRAEANRLVDLAVDLAQRTVSHQEIRVNEAALKDKKKALELQKSRKDEEAEKQAKALLAIENEIVRLTAKREALDIEGAAEWTSKGRQGDYVRQGSRKNRWEAIGRDIDAQREKVGTLTAEYAQKVEKTQDDLIERLTEEIAAIERVIEMHRERVG